jgi:predicted glycoside hydrolase/deacetylase ChbG (UPF0249 family)
MTALSSFQPTNPASPESAHPTVLIRCDDLGMCHAVNMAGQKVLESGIPASFSVMFVCPWYLEAVDLLKQYPKASVGVHLTLNAEWKDYRWGPVSGWSNVPTLVDKLGYFHPSRAALREAKPKAGEIEKELRAQIERALESGLTIDYLDSHMEAAVDTMEGRVLVESLAREYNLGISRYFGEVGGYGVYDVPLDKKLNRLLSRVHYHKSGSINILVFHVGVPTPELDALRDLNSFGMSDMSRHRDAELRALLSPEFNGLLKSQGAVLTTYRDVIKSSGLASMARPALRGWQA